MRSAQTSFRMIRAIMKKSIKYMITNDLLIYLINIL